MRPVVLFENIRKTIKKNLFLIFIFFVGLVLRVFYVVHFAWNQQLFGDPFYFHWQGYLLAHFKGFSDPFSYLYELSGTTPPRGFRLDGNNLIRASARHPPLFSIFIMIDNFFGLNTIGEQMLSVAFFSSLNVFILPKIAERLFSRNVGYVSAILVALLPNTWVFTSNLYAEAFLQFICALFLLEIYDLIFSFKLIHVILASILAGLCALTRAELILAAVFAPCIIAIKYSYPLLNKLKYIAISLICFLAVIMPWVVRNLIVFPKTVIMATDVGGTLEGANCPLTYHGQIIGYFTSICNIQGSFEANQSIIDSENENKALNYIKSHELRFVEVGFIRVGRVLFLYRPYQEAITISANYDSYFPYISGYLLWFGTYFLVISAIFGTVFARREKKVVFPLLGIFLIGLTAVFLTYGDVRFLAAAWPGLELLSAYSIWKFYDLIVGFGHFSL